MSKGGCTALEAIGLVIASLSAQAVIRGLSNEDSEPLWGVFNGVPGGLTGQMFLLGFIALVGMAFGGWAHTRQKRHRAGR
ncbi:MULTISPECIES: hypothetical protein [unclassified Streptomyces]|uniref:hypothetical protein n=1 Tax=unclassified Streptomyces TaxID=2593676 RepID=UPI002DDBCBD9|nr:MULTISPECIES: hypothetical protein [unclassified Streptomyces]WSA96609.1 hypothetical protein OIE63_37430 [Streptomyces sp. NBC_01795]WSB81023.1 hypothetical protein OHB04_38545 [Streptomyces sp. NBC_01775]WSS10766.1 hypothetical protein OG533_01710 [Streptomyces sp. NBC_01186]WSS39465.1 hypothetical protein OG220_01750 [Streptomyces sp. NBC_01187]